MAIDKVTTITGASHNQNNAKGKGKGQHKAQPKGQPKGHVKGKAKGKVTPTHFTFSKVNKKKEHISEAHANLGKLYAEKVYRCFDPYKWFMSIFFRFPLSWKISDNGSYLFYYEKKSINAIGFGITSVIIGIVTILFAMNMVGSFLNFPKVEVNQSAVNLKDLRFEETFIMRRNIVPLIILITSLCHATFGSWQFFRVRHFAASYFTFWTEAVELVRIDVASGVRKYMTVVMISYGIFLILFVSICAMRFSPVSSGGPGVLGILCIRMFYPTVHTLEKFWILRGCAGALFFYIMVCSKAFMLLFLLICKLLKNSFVVWNQRLERVLLHGEDEAPRGEKIINRTGFDHLFKDHVCLLDMIEGADALFSNMIESYYTSQVISVIFEIYYFYKSQADPEEFKGARRYDAAIITFYLIQTLVILFIVSIQAAEVGEEAMEGLDVLRRKGMMRDMDDDEMYFMLSLYTSYTGHFETSLSGSGYFTLDKGFVVTIVGTVFSYFIILIQFSPSLILTKKANSLVGTYNLSDLLQRVEGTYHYGKPNWFTS